MQPISGRTLNLRNLLLLVLFVWLVIPPGTGPQTHADEDEDQMVAMFEMPPSNPAATPNVSSPIARLLPPRRDQHHQQGGEGRRSQPWPWSDRAGPPATAS